jgi:probable rRNA maturation factor
VNIYVENNQTDLQITNTSVIEVVQAFINFENIKVDEVSVNLVDTQMICQLHEDYFNDPTTTDCISFPMDEEEEEGYRVLGEIFICPKTALDYAAANELDPYEETTLYIIHGLLHLIGLDDIDPEDQKKMRSRERIHCKNLKNLNLRVKKI